MSKSIIVVTTTTPIPQSEILAPMLLGVICGLLIFVCTIFSAIRWVQLEDAEDGPSARSVELPDDRLALG